MHIWIYTYIYNPGSGSLDQSEVTKTKQVTEISTGFCWIHSTAKGIDPFSVPKTGRTCSQGWNMISLRKCGFQYIPIYFQYISEAWNAISKSSLWLLEEIRSYPFQARAMSSRSRPGLIMMIWSATKIGKFLGFSWRIVGFCWDFENHSFLNITHLITFS
jgi:hypothetical protein